MAIRLTAAFALTLALAGCRDAKHAADEGDASALLFGDERVHALELSLEMSAMAELAREPRDWVPGSLRLRGRRYGDVAVRFKGHRSLRSWADKPAFKLDFGKYHKGRRILGLDGLVLNNMVDDPTMLRESLGSRVFAALAVPAPRVGFAELSINGRRFGLYTLVEPVDERFLARHFGAGDGPLYEGEYGCDLYEDDVWGFALDSGRDPGRGHLQALAQAIAGPPGAWLLGKRPLVDRRGLLGYLALSALLGDFDGYRHAHNYRIYRDPSSGVWSFIPWGIDRILKQRLRVFDSNGLLARRCFEDHACRIEYVKTLQAAAQRFEGLSLEKAVDRLQGLIAAAAARDPRKPYNGETRAEALSALRRFIRERPAEVRAQAACWDGTRELDGDGDGAGCLDCDDADPAIHPGADEACDGKDNDCSGNADDAPACTCPTLRVGEAEFALCNLPMAWWQAKAFCEARGQTLARLDSSDEAKPVQAAAQALRADTWWVGLDDREHEGVYRWQDGSKPKRKLWARGEPDHYTCGQNCAALQEGGGGRLRDLHCATRSPFICREQALAAPP